MGDVVRVEVVIGGEKASIVQPLPDSERVAVLEPKACRACKATPLFVRGRGKRIGGRDYYEATACCERCGEQVGTIRAFVQTIFGLEEDERVIHGSRCRSY